MDEEKKQPPNQYDPVAEAKSKLLFAAVVLFGMLFCKYVLGWG